EVDRLSYNPMHDYRTVEVGEWSKVWFAEFADLDPDSERYRELAGMAHRGLYLHPNERESDAKDLSFGMLILSMLGQENPYGQEAQLRARQDWEHMHDIAELIGRQVVRVTLEDAEHYAALRMEQERSGTDPMTRLLNRHGLTSRLYDLYRISN